MPRQIPLDATSPRFRITLDLEGVEFSLRFYWLEVAHGWYVDALRPDGTPVGRGYRIEPSGVLPLPTGVDIMPPGVFTATGPSDYQRDDLGTELQVFYLTAAEVDGG